MGALYIKSRNLSKNTKIEYAINNLKYEYGIDIPREEIEYHIANLTSMGNEMRLLMTRYFMEKYFTLPVINTLSKYDFIHLLLVIKEILFQNSCVVLPFLLAGNDSGEDLNMSCDLTVENIVESFMKDRFTSIMYDSQETTHSRITFKQATLENDIKIFLNLLQDQGE